MTKMVQRVEGPSKRLFAEAGPSADETAFRIENTSDAYYDSPYFLKHKEDVQAVPAPREDPPRMDLNQPGVYFTLDAPFVSIIGLYTNVLDGPGVLSSQDGHYPTVGDEQLAFLKSELERLRPEREALERAVIVACHHPPASVSEHSGSEGLEKDLDGVFEEAGLFPDAVLSGHAHLYQRYTRKHGEREIPYVVAGAGGFSETFPRTKINAPLTHGSVTVDLEHGKLV